MRMLRPNSCIAWAKTSMETWATMKSGTLCTYSLKTRSTSEADQKKAADMITGMKSDLSRRIRASIWRLLKSNNVRAVAADRQARSRNMVRSKMSHARCAKTEDTARATQREFKTIARAKLFFSFYHKLASLMKWKKVRQLWILLASSINAKEICFSLFIYR